jgi:hypothetical protein
MITIMIIMERRTQPYRTSLPALRSSGSHPSAERAARAVSGANIDRSMHTLQPLRPPMPTIRRRRWLVVVVVVVAVVVWRRYGHRATVNHCCTRNHVFDILSTTTLSLSLIIMPYIPFVFNFISIVSHCRNLFVF